MRKWPWVARETAEAWRQLLTEERQRYDALLQRYHALKMTGAEEGALGTRVEPKAPDRVVLAAMSRAAGNYRLQAHYLNVIREMRAAATDDETIISAIAVGLPDDPATVGVGD